MHTELWLEGRDHLEYRHEWEEGIKMNQRKWA
jgi:hypothetical protein